MVVKMRHSEPKFNQWNGNIVSHGQFEPIEEHRCIKYKSKYIIHIHIVACATIDYV
jgi:hypothetical protein